VGPGVERERKKERGVAKRNDNERKTGSKQGSVSENRFFLKNEGNPSQCTIKTEKEYKKLGSKKDHHRHDHL
jgi:hypothetical protein